MRTITCNNGDLIKETSNFEVEGFELVYSRYTTSCGSGYDSRLYVNEDGYFLVYTRKNGYEGIGSDDFSLELAGLFGADEFEVANEYFDIDSDDYLEFTFNDLSLEVIDDEYKVMVNFTNDFYQNYLFCMNIYDTDEIYKIEEYYDKHGEPKEKFTSVDIRFNTLYVGSADGEDTWYVDRDIVEKELGEEFTYKEFIEVFGDSDDREWTDFGFVSYEDCVVKFGDGLADESDFKDFCLYEDLI